MRSMKRRQGVWGCIASLLHNHTLSHAQIGRHKNMAEIISFTPYHPKTKSHIKRMSLFKICWTKSKHTLKYTLMQIPLLTNTSFNGWLECVCVCVSACMFEAVSYLRSFANMNIRIIRIMWVWFVCFCIAAGVSVYTHTCIYAHEWKQSRLSCNFVCYMLHIRTTVCVYVCWSLL